MTKPVAAGASWLEDDSGRRFPLEGNCSLGRSATNGVPLRDDANVSRQHAEIQRRSGGGYWLVDFGSRNGTYLNGFRSLKPARLKAGDRIRIGSNEFVFHEAGAAPDPRLSVLQEMTAHQIVPQSCWLLVADIINSTAVFRGLPQTDLPKYTGQWVEECRQIIEGGGGRINQFMGDGFFAYWHDRGQTEARVSHSLKLLQHFQQRSPFHFRLVIHLGEVTIGGVSVGEEERISGSEVPFVFRMEKLAGRLNEPRLLSAAAAARLGALLPVRAVGSHSLDGFEGAFLFHAF